MITAIVLTLLQRIGLQSGVYGCGATACSDLKLEIIVKCRILQSSANMDPT